MVIILDCWHLKKEMVMLSLFCVIFSWVLLQSMVDGALCVLGFLGMILVAPLVGKFWKKYVHSDFLKASDQNIECYLVQSLCWLYKGVTYV
jgi:hypothetical protein